MGWGIPKYLLIGPNSFGARFLYIIETVPKVIDFIPSN